jgi:hypothetical protein
MIDIQTENMLSFKDTTELAVFRRRGHPLHVSCIYRYALAGVKGVKLEHVVTPAGRMTSLEAVERFIHMLTEGGPQPARPWRAREKAVAAAEAELAKAGI